MIAEFAFVAQWSSGDDYVVRAFSALVTPSGDAPAGIAELVADACNGQRGLFAGFVERIVFALWDLSSELLGIVELDSLLFGPPNPPGWPLAWSGWHCD